MQNLQSALGIVVLIAFACVISERRSTISVRRIAIGLVVTLALAIIFLKIPPVRDSVATAGPD